MRSSGRFYAARGNLQTRRWLVDQRREAVEMNNITQLTELMKGEQALRAAELTELLQTAILQKSDRLAECVKLVLDHGADPDGCSGSGCPYIVTCSEYGCVTILQLLLTHGAKCSATREDGATALHRAAYQGHHECVQALLEARANIEAMDSQGRTPLILAAQHQQVHIMETLLRAGADEDALDLRNNSALYWSCYHGLVDAVDYLADESEVLNAVNSDGYTALSVSAKLGHSECVRILLRHGAKTEVEFFGVHANDNLICNNTLKFRGSSSDEYVYDSVLLMAAKYRRDNICKQLVKRGAHIEVYDQHGAGLLYYLVDYSDCVELLLLQGIDASGKIDDKRWHQQYAHNHAYSPAHRAVIEDHAESLCLLLQANSSLNPERKAHCRLKLPDAIVKGSLQCAQVLYMYSVALGNDLTWLHVYLRSRPLQTLCNIRPNVAAVRDWLISNTAGHSLQLSLARLCRRVIRDCMSARAFSANVYTLPLPTMLIRYLIMTDITVQMAQNKN